MAFMDYAQASAQPRSRGLLSGILSFFSSLAAAQSRVEEVERLTAKSDDELARMGLKREDIARYVFRDILYI